MATCSFELITPEQAQAWLDLRHRNRILSAGAVERLAGAMRRGEWMSDSTDAIGIDTDGGVINGQHRLSAIVESGVSVEMLVVREVNPDVIKVIDQGRGRTFTQWLSLDGRYAQPTVLGGAVTWLYRMTEGHEAKMNEAVRPTVPQLLDLLANHPNIEMSIEPAVEVWNRLRLGRDWLTAYHYAMASASSETADEFFVQLATGEGARNGEPVFALRERYVQNLSAPDTKQVKGPELAAWLVKAWNAQMSEGAITSKQLRWIKTGKSAEAFPIVHDVDWIAAAHGALV